MKMSRSSREKLRLHVQSSGLSLVEKANVFCPVLQPGDKVHASKENLRDRTRELDPRLGGVDGGLNAEAAPQIRNT